MTTPCTKERELGIMATQINNIEKTVNRLDRKVSEGFEKINDHLADLPDKFVLRKEFQDYIKEDTRRHENLVHVQRDRMEKLWDLFKVLAPWITMALIVGGYKILQIKGLI